MPCPVQTQLLPGVLDQAEVRLASDPRNPAYTAERYRREHPHEYALAARWCVQDALPVAVVADALGASRNTISEVVRRETAGRSVEQAKQRAGLEYRHLSRLTREALTSVVLSLPAAELLSTEQRIALLRVLPIAAAVATDKAELLLGGPTARIAVESSSSPADVVDYLQRLRDEVERRRSMDLGGGDGREREAGAGAAAEAAGEVPGAFLETDRAQIADQALAPADPCDHRDDVLSRTEISRDTGGRLARDVGFDVAIGADRAGAEDPREG
jgi:hypothetical protein